MPKRKDPLRMVLHVAVYIVIFYGVGFVFDPLLRWLGGNFAGPTAAVLFSALFANWLAIRIYEGRAIADIGLHWRPASRENLLMGLAGGVGAACLVLVPPLVVGAAHIVSLHPPLLGASLFGIIFVAAGSSGEEIFFRGYGFQLLVDGLGPSAAVVPVGVIFGLLHLSNESATWFGAANTAGFGILLGYAYLRSRDLWLPVGLHFGWNFTLPLFGAHLSGIKIINEVTGHEMVWSAGGLWSGGAYGPEASVLTSAVLVVLFLAVWKAPVRRQTSPFTDPPAESASCEPSPLSSS